MSREPRPEVRPPAGPGCTRSRRITELIARRLADARAHAERGRLSEANARVLELRSGLVGYRPGDAAEPLRRSRAPSCRRMAPDDLDPSGPPRRVDDAVRTAMDEARSGAVRTIGRNAWLEAIQLSAQAIADLGRVSAADVPACPEVRSAALAVWEARHRDRFNRWARRALVGRHAIPSSFAEGSP
jgi:hypothetical protein